MVYLMPDENNSTEATKTENGASSDNLREAEQIRECLYKELGKFKKLAISSLTLQRFKYKFSLQSFMYFSWFKVWKFGLKSSNIPLMIILFHLVTPLYYNFLM